jgi:ankyrin repeat protein
LDAFWEDAVRRGDAAVVRDLLARGVTVDARDRYGQTGLMLAAHAGHLEVVELLIAAGANLNVTAKYGLSALMLALIGRHTEVVRRLAQAGADRSLRGTGAPGFGGKTAYDLALDYDLVELAPLLRVDP